MRWGRLGLIAAVALLGCGGAYAILTAPAAPRWLVASSGLLLIAGAAAAFALAVILWSVIVDDLRPSVRCGKPRLPLALSTSQASMVGYKSFTHHPVRVWAGLLLNNSFFVGWMVFDAPESLSFRDDSDQDEAA